MVTAAEILSLKKPITQEVPIPLDPGEWDAMKAAQAEVDRIERRLLLKVLDPEQGALDLASAHEDLAAAMAAVEANSVRFVFRALPRKALDDLMREHRPTAAQRDQHRADLRAQKLPPSELSYNPDTMPAALIAASLIDPVLTVEEAQALWDADNWSDGELAVLLNAAWSVNRMVKA